MELNRKQRLPESLPSPQANGLRLSQNLDDILAFAKSWVERKDGIPADWRVELDLINATTFTDFRTRSHLRGRIQDLTSRLQSLSTTLDALTEAVKAEREILQAANRSCGLASLPEEILNMIFDHVIDEDKMSRYDLIYPCEWRSAVKLSHINRHFRAVMLSCPRHWTRMHLSSKMAASCLPRSGDLPLSIRLEAFDDESYDGSWFIEPLISEILPFSHRWKFVHIVLDTLSSSQIKKERLIKEHELPDFDGSSIRHLIIHTDPWNSDVEWSPWNWSRWITPNLQSLTADYYFPHSLPGLANLTELTLTLRVNDKLISNTFEEIRGMDRLQYLSLCFETASDTAGTIFVYGKFEFPQVRRLKIGLDQSLPDDPYTPALVRSLFSSLYFPAVEDLVVELSGNESLQDVQDDDREEEWMDNCYFNKDINRIFRHVDQFPKVTNFRLDVVAARGNYNRWTELCIPLNMLPNVKHFTLFSNACLDIKDPENPDEIALEGEQRVPLRVVGEKLPVLETITLNMQDAKVAAEWLGEYLGKLKDAGEFNGFRELIVFKLKKIGKRSRRKVRYPGVKALKWCGNV